MWILSGQLCECEGGGDELLREVLAGGVEEEGRVKNGGCEHVGLSEGEMGEG